MGRHATGSAIALLDSGGVGNAVAEGIQGMLDTSTGTMCKADVNGSHATANALFDELDMRQAGGMR